MSLFLCQDEPALQMFEMYRELRDAGAKSIYARDDVERRIMQLKEPKQHERVRRALRKVDKILGPAAENIEELVATA